MKNFQISLWKWSALILVCFVSWFCISCGSPMLQSSRTTSTTGGNKAGALSLNESNLDFGSVHVGSSKSNTLTLTNSSASGGPNVTFSQVSASGNGFKVTAGSLPIVLAPKQSANITVTFAPKAAGAASGSLAIVV